MKKKRLMKSALMLAASGGLLLTQGCDEESLPWFMTPWAPVITRATVTSANVNASANTGGGQAGNNQPQQQSLSGLARTGNTGNAVGGFSGGVP